MSASLQSLPKFSAAAKRRFVPRSRQCRARQWTNRSKTIRVIRDLCRWRLQVRSPTAPSNRVLIPIWRSWSMAGQNGSTGGNIVISRRLVIGLLGAGVVAFAPYAAPVARALSPEARNAKLDETLRGLVEGRTPPGIVALILRNGRPVYTPTPAVPGAGRAPPLAPPP